MNIDVRLLDAIERLNAQEEQRAAETFRFMEEQKIKKALGPPLWEELKAKLREMSEFIANSSQARLTVSTEGAYKLVATNTKSGRAVRLTYNRDVPCVFYETPSGSGRLALRVAPDGNSVDFVLDGIPQSLDELAIRFTQGLTD